MHIKTLRKGFTLVELLVVITIIAILATLLLLQLNVGKSKGRDIKRVTSVSQLRDAIEQYYDDNGAYPTVLSAANIGKYLSNSTSVPIDPSTNAEYGYGLDATSTKYQVWAQLENTGGGLKSDSDISGAGYTGGTQTLKGTNGASEAGSGSPAKCTAAGTDCVFDLGIQ